MTPGFPPRFATLEAAQKAMNGDCSGSEIPVEAKDYGPPIGKKLIFRKEYLDAPYEIQFVSGKSPTLSVLSPE